MKRISILLAMALPAFTGCNQGTPGGPGAAAPSEKRASYGQANDTFNLNAPLLATSLTQGETKAVSIRILRGKNFDEEVTLKFEGLPKGVSFDPSRPTIKHGDEETKFTVHATNDAALGNFAIKVTGHPSKGGDALIEFKIAVNKK